MPILNDGSRVGFGPSPIPFTEMVAELQGMLGVAATDTLYTPARLGRWLNTAQIQIAQRWPRLWHLVRRDDTSWVLQATVYRYHLPTVMFDAAVSPAQTVLGLTLIDASRTASRALEPWPGGSRAFNRAHPRPADEATGDPRFYVQTGPWFELWPVPGAAQAASGVIQIDYAIAPPELREEDDVVTLTGWEDEIIALAAALARVHRARSDRELLAVGRDQLVLAWELINQRALDDDPDGDDTVVWSDSGPM